MASTSAKKDIIRRKLVIVGDGACGKTSLLSVFTLGYFPKVCYTFLVLPIWRIL
jgi:Rho family, other